MRSALNLRTVIYLTVSAAKGLDKDEEDKKGKYIRKEALCRSKTSAEKDDLNTSSKAVFIQIKSIQTK